MIVSMTYDNVQAGLGKGLLSYGCSTIGVEKVHDAVVVMVVAMVG